MWCPIDSSKVQIELRESRKRDGVSTASWPPGKCHKTPQKRDIAPRPREKMDRMKANRHVQVPMSTIRALFERSMCPRPTLKNSLSRDARDCSMPQKPSGQGQNVESKMLFVVSQASFNQSDTRKQLLGPSLKLQTLCRSRPSTCPSQRAPMSLWSNQIHDVRLHMPVFECKPQMKLNREG